MKQTNIVQPLDGFDSSPLVLGSPRLLRTGEPETVIVTTLSPAGHAFMFSRGRKALVSKLYDECIPLADHARTASARWLFTDSAADPADFAVPVARPILPDVVGYGEPGLKRILLLYVPENLAWFDGHFPGDPIMPAVVQIDWAIHFGADFGLDQSRFAGLSRLKFRSVITPGMVLRLTLVEADDTLKFVFESRDGVHSSGAIRFHHDDNDG